MKSQLILILSTMIFSAIGVLIITPFLIRYFKRTSSLDIPNHRSAHVVPTPTMGGISFFIGLVCTVVFSWNIEMFITCMFIASAGAVGWWDDLKGVEPKVKFAFQGLIASGLFLCGFSIAPFLELAFGLDLPSFIDWMITVLFFLGVMNAFNLIDGIDGLLIGVTLISSVVLSILFFLLGEWNFLFLTMSMIGVTSTFLVYNFQPARIFMGDTGSLIIGTYIAACVLKVSEFGSSELSFIAISVVLFACVDMLRLFLGRYLILKKPFKADRNHFHHILLRLGWSHKKIALNAYVLQAIVVCVALLLRNNSSFIGGLLVLILACVSFYGGLQLLIFRKHRKLWKKNIKARDMKIGNNELLKSYLK